VAPRSDKVDPAPSSAGNEAEPPSFAVGHDGKIDGIYRPRDQRRSWTPNDWAQLELAERPRVEPAPPEPPAPRRAQTSPRKAIALAIIAAALILAPFAARWGLRLWSDYKAGSAKASGLIVIDSIPSNARLFINGAEVGRTPYVAPNRFPPGSRVSASIVYPGAQEWSGTFPGGVDTSFTAELQSAESPK
jgi:hypothetical protein